MATFLEKVFHFDGTLNTLFLRYIKALLASFANRIITSTLVFIDVNVFPKGRYQNFKTKAQTFANENYV